MNTFPDQLLDTVSSNGTIGHISVFKDPSPQTVIYEIIRVIDGVAIFLEDHISRFITSAEILSIPIDTCKDNIHQWVVDYITQCSIETGNLKFAYFYHQDKQPTFLVYATKFAYPPAELYTTGIKTDLLNAERLHPNAKDEQPVRAIANTFIAEHSLYEALLVNADGTITEGSKSNFFAQLGNRFITAPGETVLKGITRKYVIQAIEECGFVLEERLLNTEELASATGAFISGTSPKILPIATIGDISFRVPTGEILLLIKQYEHILKDYIFTAKRHKI